MTVEPATAPDSRRLDIQGLRAVAVLVVVCFHAGLPVPGGFIGVDVFFVISGFVITGMLSREWMRSGRIRFRGFYARRFKRLTPALALMVTTTVLLAVVIGSPIGAQQVTSQTGIGAMLLAANIVIARTTGGYFDAAAETNPLLNTWSLSVEEQFYLVFPLLLMLGWVLRRRLSGGRAIPVLMVSAVAAASFGLMMLTSRGGQVPFISSDLLGFYGPLSRAWEFAAGALLALSLSAGGAGQGGRRSGLRSPVWTGTAQGVIGLGMVVASLWLLNESVPGPGLRNLIPVIGTVLLLRAGIYDANPVSRLLATRPLVRLGDLSYSWYLWHWPIIVFSILLWPGRPLIPVVAALASLAPSIASYRWVEKPIRTARVTTKFGWARLISLTMLPPIVIAASLLWVAGHGYWSTSIVNYQQARVSHLDVLTDCAAALPAIDPGWDRCRWNESGRGKPIYLLGDSNAGHFSEAVIGAAELTGRPVMIFTVHGCPFMDVRAYRPPTQVNVEPGCPEYVANALNWLKGQPPGLVILSSSSSPWSPPEFSTIESEPWSMTTSTSEYLESVITSTVQEVQAMGNQVLLVMTVPHFSMPPHQLNYDRCSIWSILGDGCTQTMPQAITDRAQGNLRRGITNAAQATGAQVLDLRGYFCPDSMCSTRKGNLVLYSDAGHLSVAGGRDLVPEFLAAIGE